MRGDGYTNSAPIYSLSVDIWSVAVIFMELALLQPPFRADCEMVYLLEVCPWVVAFLIYVVVPADSQPT